MAKKKETQTAAKSSESKKKIKILLPPAGRFFLSYAVGEEVEMEAKQAQELIDARYAEAVK